MNRYTGKLIETHCHIDNVSGESYAQKILNLLKLENIDYALLLGGRNQDFQKVIDFLSPYHKKVGLLLFIEPDKHNKSDIAKLIENNNRIIKGFKFHPSFHGFKVSVETCEYIFQLANEYNIIINTHTDISENSNSENFRPLLEKYPKTKLILSHAFPFDSALDLASKFENVYIDTSYTAWNKEFQQRALKILGKEKILYGIDSPIGFKKDEKGEFLPHYREAAYEVAEFYNYDENVIPYIMYKNAEKILKNLGTLSPSSASEILRSKSEA